MKAKPYAITIQQIIELNACEDQVYKIRDAFGEVIELTKENIEKATKMEFDAEWLRKLLINPEHIEEYKTKHREYNREWINSCNLDAHGIINGGNGSACKKEDRNLVFMDFCRFSLHNSLF